MIEQDKVLTACSYHLEVLAKSPQSGGRQRFCSMTLFFLEIVLRADGTCCIYQPEPRILALWQRGQKVLAHTHTHTHRSGNNPTGTSITLLKVNALSRAASFFLFFGVLPMLHLLIKVLQ